MVLLYHRASKCLFSLIFIAVIIIYDDDDKHTDEINWILQHDLIPNQNDQCNQINNEEDLLIYQITVIFFHILFTSHCSEFDRFIIKLCGLFRIKIYNKKQFSNNGFSKTSHTPPLKEKSRMTQCIALFS